MKYATVAILISLAIACDGPPGPPPPQIQGPVAPELLVAYYCEAVEFCDVEPWTDTMRTSCIEAHTPWNVSQQCAIALIEQSCEELGSSYQHPECE